MITVKSKNHNGAEVLINENNILYAVASYNNETIVHLSKESFLVLAESFESFKQKFELQVQPTVSHYIAATSKPDTSDYPEDLPRLPNGNIDKRTTAYKEYVANL
jgi:hypothetical protein